MNDDRTVILKPSQGNNALRICYQLESSAPTINRILTKASTIGRQTDCDIQVLEQGVSRYHAELLSSPQGWSIRDLDSANGTFLNGKPIKAQQFIIGSNEIQLGLSGPKLWVEPIVETTHSVNSEKTTINTPNIRNSENVNSATSINSDQKPEQPKPQQTTSKNERSGNHNAENLSPEALHQYYFGEQENKDMGDKTRLLRKIIKQEKSKQSHRYRVIIFIFSLLFLAVTSLAIFQQFKLQQTETLAVDIFYDMKAIEVQIAQYESQQQKLGYLSQVFNVSSKRAQLSDMEQRYQDYLEKMNTIRLFKQKPDYEVEIIYRVARIFGETELMVPEDFVAEVNKYINLWKASKRLPNAIARLNRLRLTPIVVNALDKQNLPPQFLYLSLQESNFKNESIGPKTRYGHAKGLWQFIPSTATEYGLKIGSLSGTNQYDAEDDRFDFNKATDAAARYLKDIYGNEAQASGLLVMASYNWGHNRVRKLIQSMPDNPRDRNFWQLIQKHKIPKETYDYVFYIFSAAVICEDPKHFGFDFENPLKG